MNLPVTLLVLSISLCQAQLYDLDLSFLSALSYNFPSSSRAPRQVGYDENGKHLCDRECVEGEAPLDCHFEFKIELFNTLSKACHDCPNNITDCYRQDCVPGDGMERGIIAINRQMPGPPVIVCQGDRVTVDVYNHLHTETFSIHWHGEHQRNHQYMDGVPHVTQCPILPTARFRYSFEAQIAGTHFYHSHSSFQRGDGAFGPYVVREPKSVDPQGSLYDHDLSEHIIFAQEWFHINEELTVYGFLNCAKHRESVENQTMTSQSTREAFVLHHWDTGKNKADNLLVNGKGRFRMFGDSKDIATPTEYFDVQPGQRYRFRVVSPGFTLCPIQVSVDRHNITMIASDGNPIEPLGVKSFIISPGERYDFVLDANQEPSTYLMKFAGLFDCSPLEAHAVARVHYQGTTLSSLDEDIPYQDCLETEGALLNPLNYAPVNDSMNFNPNWIPINEARGIPRHCAAQEPCETHPALKETADKVFYLGYDLYPKDNPHFHDEDLYSFEEVEGGNKLRTPQINNITLMLPTTTLLSQDKEIDPNLFCNEESLSERDCGGSEFCECIYVLDVDVNDTVEFVLIDEGRPYDVTHPFHIHGHSFFVVAMERHAGTPENIGAGSGEGNSILKQTVVDMNESGSISKNLVNPPFKDTVTVPDSGFTILRFYADNPGYWHFHCHMSWHNHLGMGVIIKVGNMESDVGPVPSGFPECRDFV